MFADLADDIGCRAEIDGRGMADLLAGIGDFQDTAPAGGGRPCLCRKRPPCQLKGGHCRQSQQGGGSQKFPAGNPAMVHVGFQIFDSGMNAGVSFHAASLFITCFIWMDETVAGISSPLRLVADIDLSKSVPLKTKLFWPPKNYRLPMVCPKGHREKTNWKQDSNGSGCRKEWVHTEDFLPIMG